MGGSITGDTTIFGRIQTYYNEHQAQDRAGEEDSDSQIMIPVEAYVSKEDAEATVEYDVDVTDQEQLDDWFRKEGNRFLLQTDLYHDSTYEGGDVLISSFYDDDLYFKDVLHINTPLAERPMYGIGSTGAGGGSGGPTALPIDFRYSPFVQPSLLNEKFEIEAVLRAGFLPGFRPGEDAIMAHPDRYATIRVMSIDKKVIYATTNFMMKGYNKATKESLKVIESTLGNSLQLNKEKFKIFKMRLGLVDAIEPFDWLRSWEDKWDRYMRASVLARNRWRWYILFGSHLIGGYPIQYTLGANAKEEPYAGISVDIFVTNDVRLPDMKRMTTESGLVYFRWGGTTYNSNSLQFESTIQEYPTAPPKATSPDESEFEDEP